MLICSYLPISALYTIYLEILDIRKEVVTVFGPVHCQVICPPPPPSSPLFVIFFFQEARLEISRYVTCVRSALSFSSCIYLIKKARAESYFDNPCGRVIFFFWYCLLKGFAELLTRVLLCVS